MFYFGRFTNLCVFVGGNKDFFLFFLSLGTTCQISGAQQIQDACTNVLT